VNEIFCGIFILHTKQNIQATNGAIHLWVDFYRKCYFCIVSHNYLGQPALVYLSLKVYFSINKLS